MPLLSADEILGAEDLKTEDVEVPEWGGTVRIRTLTGTEREEFEQALRDRGKVRPDDPNMRALLVTYSACDANGGRLFSLAQAEKLGRKSGRALDRLASVALRLSMLSDQQVEDAAKN